MDAGPALYLTGPEGTRELPRTPSGSFYENRESLGGGIVGEGEQAPPSYLVPGQYTVDNDAGGADVQHFQHTITLPPPPEWTNEDSINEVDRSRDLTVTWNAPRDTSAVMIVVGSSPNYVAGTAASFICAQRASAGSFTVPARVLSSLPPSNGWPGGEQTIPILSLALQPHSETGKFWATRIDQGYFYYRTWVGKTMIYR